MERTLPARRTGTFAALLDSTVARHGERTFLPRRHAHGGDPVTFAELLKAAREIAAGLAAVGMTRGDRAGLIADNRFEWLAADLGCAQLGVVDVPRGTDTTPSELVFILAHSGCRFAFVENAATAKTLLAHRTELPELQRICVLHGPAPEGTETLDALREHGRRWSEVEDLDARIAEVSPDDLLTIVYTSGTTAEPKGVMLSHQNVLSNLETVSQVLDIHASDVFLSVLPAWHMYERMLDYVALAVGAQLVYTDRRRIKEDLKAVRPTVFAAVPRIWEMIHDGIVHHAERAKGLRRALLRWMLTTCRRVGSRRCNLLHRAVHRIFDATLLPKVRQSTGGRLRLAVSGGGSLPSFVDELLLGLGVPLLNGYGLTETSPVAAVRIPARNRPGVIGPPLPRTEIQVRDHDGSVLSATRIGVLFVRGPQVMKGYYRNEKRTAEVLDRDGWFNTGDLGCVESDGQLRITGRAKDTIVLASGENVEPEPLEIATKTSLFIDQIVVVGQDRKSLGALVVPTQETLEQAIPRSEWEMRDGLMHGKNVHQLLRRELDRILTRDAGFRAFERITTFRVLIEPLTIDNGFLTQTLKVKRHVVHDRFATLIEQMFDSTAVS